MTKTPRTPRKPGSTPVPKPTGATRTNEGFLPRVGDSGARRSIATAATRRSKANASRIALPPTSLFSAVPTIAPETPAAPKISPVRTSTRPIRAWSAAPAGAAVPTTSRDSVVASLASSPRVDEHGHREDRAAGVDGTEQEPDREPEGQGEERPTHCSSRVRTSRREGCGRAGAGAPGRGGRARGARSVSAPAGSTSRRAGRRCQG